MNFIKRDNIKYSEEALKRMVLETIEKYKVDVLNDDVIVIKDNKLDIYLEILIKEKMATVSGTANVIKNEIIDSLIFFSKLEADAIQIQIKKERIGN